MWKSLFSGLKESVGFTLGSPETQKVKPLSKKEQRKLEREQRKNERKEKKKRNSKTGLLFIIQVLIPLLSPF
ncbi:MAG: hypothetical protein WBJ10_15605 [Daejeonella sp.]|uniref:hypothetical protein n=1 Tax=Daejeonella sp. TaxID=2805397 RepID=UPI003C72A2A2